MKALLVVFAVVLCLTHAEADEEPTPCGQPLMNITLPQVEGGWYAVEYRSEFGFSTFFLCTEMRFQPDPAHPGAVITTGAWHNDTGFLPRVRLEAMNKTDDGIWRLYHLSSDGRILVVCYTLWESEVMFILTRDKEWSLALAKTVDAVLPSRLGSETGVLRPLTCERRLQIEEGIAVNEENQQ